MKNGWEDFAEDIDFGQINYQFQQILESRKEMSDSLTCAVTVTDSASLAKGLGELFVDLKERVLELEEQVRNIRSPTWEDDDEDVQASEPKYSIRDIRADAGNLCTRVTRLEEAMERERACTTDLEKHETLHHEQIKLLQARVNDAQNKHDDLESELHKLKCKVGQLKDNKEENEKLHFALQELNKLNGALTERAKFFASKLEETTKSNKELQEQCFKLLNNQYQLVGQLNQMQAQLAAKEVLKNETVAALETAIQQVEELAKE